MSAETVGMSRFLQLDIITTCWHKRVGSSYFRRITPLELNYNLQFFYVLEVARLKICATFEVQVNY